MKAEVKNLSIDGASFDENFVPDDKSHFSIYLRLILGPKGVKGEESFDITVCTPSWISEKLGDNEVLLGRHHLFLKEYNYQNIITFIQQYVSSCTGNDWNEVGLKLSRLGYWEFEDYKELF